jgi:hypothetical protein
MRACQIRDQPPGHLCLISTHRDPYGARHGACVTDLKHDGHVSARLNADGNLQIHLHQTGDLSWRGARVLNDSRNTSHRCIHLLYRLWQGTPHGDLSVHACGQSLAFAGGVKRNVSAHSDRMCRTIHRAIACVNGSGLACTGLVQREQAGCCGVEQQRKGCRCFILVAGTHLYYRWDHGESPLHGRLADSLVSESGCIALRSKYTRGARKR